jgi:predicted sulfurtransferase
MACSTESWIHARNATTMCPHPAITACAECETPLCSAHITECDECGRFLCRECASEHSHEVHEAEHTTRAAA